MKKIIIIFVLLLLVGCMQNTTKVNKYNLNTEKIEVKTAENVKLNTSVDIKELEKHDTINDCWIVYEDNVYDVSNWESKSFAKKIQYYCGDEISEEWLIKNKYGNDFIKTIEAFGILKGRYNN